MSVYSTNQKALYVIHKRVAKKFPNYTYKQTWFVTYILYDKSNRKNRDKNNTLTGRKRLETE